MTDLSKVEAAYTQLAKGADQLLGRVHAQEAAVAAVQEEVKALTSEVQVLTFTTTALQTLLRAVSVESLESVEQLETYGLRAIFDDQALAFKVETTTKRGIQWMTPKLLQGTIEAPILDAFGGGPASVVAFLLRVLVCRRLGLAPVILLDEPFAMVSAEYIDNVGKLLRELAERLSMTFIMVTHERGFLSFAHHAYEAVETAQGTTFKAVEGSQ